VALAAGSPNSSLGAGILQKLDGIGRDRARRAPTCGCAVSSVSPMATGCAPRPPTTQRSLKADWPVSSRRSGRGRVGGLDEQAPTNRPGLLSTTAIAISRPARCRRSRPSVCNSSPQGFPDPQGQRSFRQSFRASSLSPWTTRSPRRTFVSDGHRRPAPTCRLERRGGSRIRRGAPCRASSQLPGHAGRERGVSQKLTMPSDGKASGDRFHFDLGRLRTEVWGFRAIARRRRWSRGRSRRAVPRSRMVGGRMAWAEDTEEQRSSYRDELPLIVCALDLLTEESRPRCSQPGRALAPALP
jgi:hypothetical protein